MSVPKLRLIWSSRFRLNLAVTPPTSLYTRSSPFGSFFYPLPICTPPPAPHSTPLHPTKPSSPPTSHFPANRRSSFAQDADISTSEIIFLELANLLKKLKANFVIKKFRCDPFGALRETT